MKCPNCEASLSTQGSCSECGWVGATVSWDSAGWSEFSPGDRIAERFVITRGLDTEPGHATRLYLAEDEVDGQAVKVKEAISGTPAAEALQRENEILSVFSYPSIPQVVHFCQMEHSSFLMLQFLEGATLDQAWSEEHVSEEQHLDWLLQLCDALNELHSQGMLYLAVHPQHLLVTGKQVVVLDDFSRARILPLSEGARLLGWQHYSAPEVFLSPADVTARADIYGFGATWYGLLLGSLLTSDQFEGEFFAKQPVEFRPDILPAVNRVIAKAMQRLPERRQKTVPYLREALEGIRGQLGQEPPVAYGAYSDTGLTRDANEDSYLVEQFALRDDVRGSIRCGLYLVSDGMGGEAGGAVASSMTVRAFSEAILPVLNKYRLRDSGRDLSTEMKASMQDAVNKACAAVYDRAHDDPLLRHMGATLVVAVMLGPHLYVANVGDSRAYLIGQTDIKRLTVDHTVIAQLIERGDLDEVQARDHPAQGELTRNIGAKPRAEVHFHHQQLRLGDALLLCCDGLTDVIEDEEIRGIVLAAHDRQVACHHLVNLANSRGGPDNVTLILTAYDPGWEATNGA